MRADTRGQDARETMARWRDYRGSTPLGRANDGHATDRCRHYLSDANSLLSMLSAAFEDSQSILNRGGESVFDSRAGNVMAGALDGVATLIDMAPFLLPDE